jgi:hypothetical protein
MKYNMIRSLGTLLSTSSLHNSLVQRPEDLRFSLCMVGRAHASISYHAYLLRYVSHLVRTHLSSVLSYNTWKVTNITHYSMKIMLLASLLGKAKIVLYYKYVCHDCTTILRAVNSVKCRVGANMVSRTVPIFRRKKWRFTHEKTYHVSWVA